MTIVSGRRRVGTPRTVTARVMSILSAFSREHPVLGLADICRRTGLSSSTTHRLVTELAEWGALARTSDLRYRIGPTLRRLCENPNEVPVTVSSRGGEQSAATEEM